MRENSKYQMPWKLQISSPKIVALTIFGESRGEKREDQCLVGNIILNRWKLKKNNIAFRTAVDLGDICLWKNQFSCWNETDPNRAVILRTIQNPSSAEGLVLKQCSWIAEGFCEGIFSDEINAGDHYHHFPDGHPQWPRWATKENEIGKFGKAMVYRLWK